MSTHRLVGPRSLVCTLLLAFICLSSPLVHACGAVDGGATSCNGGNGDNVASLGNTSGTNNGAGNPINVMTGNKYQREVDLPALPGVLGLEIVRHYNSAYSGPTLRAGAFGRGWKLSYETELFDVAGKVQVVQADGSRILFDHDPLRPNLCASRNPANGSMVLHRQTDGRTEYDWTWTDGRRLHFNAAGRLETIRAPSGETVHLLYDSRNLLVRVIDPFNRSLSLIYPDRRTAAHGYGGVAHIDSPVGRFSYEYGAAPASGTELLNLHVRRANLARVRLPTSYDATMKTHAYANRGTTVSRVSRLYHYEDGRFPTLLTGISVETVGVDGKPVLSRYASFGYDQNGRANLSTHAGDADKITLATPIGGQTILTNSLGQQTVYRHAIIGGEHRLLEVRGAGCALCGPVNVRYQYDILGRLTDTIELNRDGQPMSKTHFALDRLGRTVEVSDLVWQGGKAQASQWRTRYAYTGNQFAPSAVIRPSVVPGKEMRTDIRYNRQGQPLQVLERGWAPDVRGKGATALVRATSYRYGDFNGRSLLTQIDGPLPNGPSNSPVDSDITVFEYDHRPEGTPRISGPTRDGQLALYDDRPGILTAIITPGNFKTSLQYDDAGRIASVSDAEGHQTALRYDPRNRIIATSRDGITLTTSYDAFDHPVETAFGDDAGTHPLQRFGYDAAGRAMWTTSAIGIVSTWRYDTEGKLLDTATQSNAIRQAWHYEYDPFNRLLAVTDPNGAIRRIAWNAQGLPATATDTLGRETRYRYDASGKVTDIIDAANSMQARLHNTARHIDRDALSRIQSVRAPDGTLTRYRHDDFGRTVATISDDSGAVTRDFDLADRLTGAIDANGNRAIYAYDVAGRIVRQTVIDAHASGPEKPSTVTTWRYAGRHLIAIDHPDQSERYRYDERGRMTDKAVTLTLPNGAPVSATCRYAYDGFGRLISSSLPDGSLLEYQRDGQQQVTAIVRKAAIGTAWLRWLAPQQTIVAHLERDAIGLKRFSYGNHIEALFQRSQSGALARIAYRYPRQQNGWERLDVALDFVSGIGSAQAAPAAMAPGALGLAPDPAALIDHRYLWDAQGNLLHDRNQSGAGNYAYDAQDRLIVASVVADSPGASASDIRYQRYHYDGAGNRLLAQEDIADQTAPTATDKTTFDGARARQTGFDGIATTGYDANGQPRAISERMYQWDALGKLREVRQGGQALARYRYNHRGERVAKSVAGQDTLYLYAHRQLAAELNDKGQLTRQYLYLGGQAIALIDTPDGGALPADGSSGSGWTQLKSDLATLWRAWFGPRGTLAWLHNNHLGATEAISDAAGAVLWRAAYSPFGALRPAAGRQPSAANGAPFSFNLRLPGQYADQETGLYYNDHRYYDPQRGRYLTPDPLGMRGGVNSYAYVNGNPLRYVDPSGLILFAFDGSGNDESDPAALTNVVGFGKLYVDEKYYITGVGTLDPPTGIGPTLLYGGSAVDLIRAYTAQARIAAMVEYLDRYADTVDDNTAFDIDIVGFSRGGAEGRDFANQIVAKVQDGYYRYQDDNGTTHCQKVNFRFMGLFDTVIGPADGGYQLSIPNAFAYVAQAVALNEYRGNAPYTFSLESILNGSPSNTNTRIERGFLGAHSDIGGGFAEQDLSTVALTWMVDQAIAAGVQMDEPSRTIIANPVLHDKSSNLLTGAPDGGPTATSEDRDVRYADGTVVRQRQTTYELMTYADTLPFITYKPDPNSIDNISGTVDAKAYLQWLKDNGYDLNMTAQ